MSEWKEYKLGEIADITKLAGFEFTKHINYVEDGEIIALRALNVREGVLDLTNVKRIKKTVSDNLIRSKLFIGDILFTYVGANIGQFAIIEENDKYHLAPNICRIRVKDEFSPYFIYCYFRSPAFQNTLKNFSVGSSQPTLPMGNLRKVPISIPPLPTQSAISEVLSSLDDKIELNNAINKNLEDLAQALFKRWFVDFEFPNENGEPYKSSGGEMVESELGEIPKGWRIGRLEEVIEIKYGKDHKHLEDGQIPVYGSGGVMRYVNKAIYEQQSILIPRKGTLSNLFYINVPFWSVDTMFYTIIKIDYQAKYLYFTLKALELASMNVGSAVPSMTTNVLNNLEIILPLNHIIKQFNDVMSSIFDNILVNKKENNLLSIVRDTLLPKLISGELAVNEAILQTEKAI